ncbi:hypothetical protein HDV00_002587 [Rhizophlyctis rosea]|nr:hypothetical protein HDV00_002587 [Rhizophlyctis rosea]
MELDAAPLHLKLSPERKAAMLANLTVEMQSRKERYERDTAELEETLLRQCRALAVLPPEIANMDMKTFCLVYGGDINLARRGLTVAEERDATGTAKTRTQRGKAKQQKETLASFAHGPIIPETPQKFANMLPETPANNATNSRRITLRSHAKMMNQGLPPPTPSICIPLGNGDILDFDTDVPVEQIKEGLGEEDRKTAYEKLKALQGDIDRILAGMV